MRLMQVGAKRQQKRGLAVTKRKLAAVRVESRHHHHVERWGTEREAPKQEGQSPKGAVLRDETRRMQKTATNGNVYLGRDPEGPLAPEEGQRPYSIHPPPNGNVRVPTPETTCETFYENPF
jgi:hypothetical protein